LESFITFSTELTKLCWF